MKPGINELPKFKTLLEQKEAELRSATGQREDIVVEAIADELDAAMQASEREFAVREHDRQTFMLRNVEAALRRIQMGEFGVCIHCEEQINRKRLEAVPWTPFCLTCQEAVDQRDEGALASLRAMLNAA